MIQFGDSKRRTKDKAIATLPEAPVLYMPLSAYHGHFSRPIVRAGDKVLKHQCIAVADDPFSVPVHSPVSGQVIGMHEFLDRHGGMAASMLVLQNDFQGACIERPGMAPDDLSPETLLDRLTESGVVGEGGAQFPAAMKYRSAGRDIKAFIINGVECEPYLTADYALMRERTEALFEGIRLVNTLLQAKDVVIVIEAHNRELEAVFAPYLSEQRHAGYRVQLATQGYPQGSERQVVHAVTGREIAPPLHPSAEGFVVSNVGTIVAARDALVHRLPVTRRIVTISGEDIPHAGNYDVPIGTPIGFLLNQLDISPDQYTIVSGGPMMGRHVTDWSTPVTKGSGGVLVLPRASVKRENCIGCSRCIEACPMQLMPLRFAEGWRRNDPGMLKRYQLNVCFECGACEYVCPANVPLMASIKAGKSILLQKGER